MNNLMNARSIIITCLVVFLFLKFDFSLRDLANQKWKPLVSKRDRDVIVHYSAFLAVIGVDAPLRLYNTIHTFDYIVDWNGEYCKLRTGMCWVINPHCTLVSMHFIFTLAALNSWSSAMDSGMAEALCCVPRQDILSQCFTSPSFINRYWRI